MNTLSDKKLLEQYAPIVHYAKGESFLPANVNNYLKRCSLIAHMPNGESHVVIERGKVTEDLLTKDHDLPKGAVLHLKLTEDLRLIDSAKVFQKVSTIKKNSANTFQAGQGRLVRVGYMSRFFDAVFTLTFMLRGSVPGLASSLAILAYHDDHKKDKDITLYARTVKSRDNGWIALQYWFFYYFNDWRSGFHGVNDHEADWEMVTVYVYQDKKGNIIPEWTAYASHDFHGDDLRRRFDDTEEFERIGTHPVVYAGAGSHASYFKKGEYQSNFPLPVPSSFKNSFNKLGEIWKKNFEFGNELSFTIPFIDYARGDGISVGAGQKQSWNIEVISEENAWVAKFKGLWGYFAQDPVSGEDAPAGPKYNRDTSIRHSWQDPFAFAGLDKVPTPPQFYEAINEQIKELKIENIQLAQTIIAKRKEQKKYFIRQSASINTNTLGKLSETLEKNIKDLRRVIEQEQKKYDENNLIIEGLQKKKMLFENGKKDDPRAHIQKLARPTDEKTIRYRRLTEIWASLSMGFILLSLVAGAIFFPQHMLLTGLIALYFFVFLESFLRGTYLSTLATVSIVIALMAGVIVIINFWLLLLMALLIASAIYLLIDNIKELDKK